MSDINPRRPGPNSDIPCVLKEGQSKPDFPCGNPRGCGGVYCIYAERVCCCHEHNPVCTCEYDGSKNNPSDNTSMGWMIALAIVALVWLLFTR